MLISLALVCIALPLGSLGSVFMYFAGPGNPFVLPAIILIPAVAAITARLVKTNGARALGAVAFYPCAALAAFVIYSMTIGGEINAERAAARQDYSSRTVAQPLGTIDVLGIPLTHRCIDTCARILLNGVANEVSGISYDKTVNLRTGTSYTVGGAPWVFRRYRLGRGAECLAEPVIEPQYGSLNWTGADVQWIQSNGVYDVCIVMTAGDGKLGDMILVDHGPNAWRPNGPKAGPVDGAAVASRIRNGQRTELARWEFGLFERSGLHAAGAPFQLWDFVKALSGKGETDRLTGQHAVGLSAAIDGIYAASEVMPNIDGWAPFEFLRQVHEQEMGRGNRREALDAFDMAKLRQIPSRICPSQSQRMMPRSCFERYNEVVGAIFTPAAASDLRWPTP